MKDAKIEFITYLPITAGMIFFLFVPFIHLKGLGIEDSIDKIMYINLVTGLITLLYIIFFYKIKKPLEVKIEDVLILLLGLCVFFLYDYRVDAAPVKLIFTGAVLIFWIVSRIAFECFKIRKKPVIYAIVLFGAAEAVLGILQVFGVIPSNHSFYLITGTFYNPGPFSGFIAMILPLGISKVIDSKQNLKYKGLNFKIEYYFFSIASILMFIILPAGMSRSAWFSAGISCLILFFIRTDVFARIKNNSRITDVSKWKKIFAGIFLAVFIICAGIFVYEFKKGSANGRVLMWKVTAEAMLNHPKGVGLGGFGTAFAESQADILSHADVSESLRDAAGSPEYAFNEYLQTGLEESFAGLLFFLAFIITVLVKTYKNKRYGIFCALLSLCIFAFSSYPFQLTEFWIYFLLFAVIGISEVFDIGEKQNKPVKGKSLHFNLRTSNIFGFMILLAIFFTTIYIFPKEEMYFNAYREYKECKFFYNSKDYDVVLREYPPLYKYLSHRTDYLFEGAQAYSKTCQYKKAVEWLKRASLTSSDPMIHYMLGKNYQALGKYEKAEKEIRYGISVIPERIYPYFLLTKLYSDPSYYYPDLFKAACDSVLYKKPKVMSPAIKEMREKVKAMLEK